MPGKQIWAFAGGHIPLISTGGEPTFTSHDKIAVLNASGHNATVKISIYYEDEAPVTDHEIIVGAQRIRKIRFNDLIDPLPVPLDKPFGFVVRSDIPIIVQFSRMNTGSNTFADFCITPFYQKDNRL